MIHHLLYFEVVQSFIILVPLLTELPLPESENAINVRFYLPAWLRDGPMDAKRRRDVVCSHFTYIQQQYAVSAKRKGHSKLEEMRPNGLV